jgi:N-acetylmuramoyl-L-alanine amidase
MAHGITTTRRYLVAMFCVLFLGACSNLRLQDRGTYLVDDSHPAISIDSRVRYLIIHYTAGSYEASLAELTKGQVSAHYLVPEQPGTVGSKPVLLQLAPEERRAWHAGVSYWLGRTNINDSSIGIEIVNRGYNGESADAHGAIRQSQAWQPSEWQPYSAAQISAVKSLALDIIARYHIKPNAVLGHSDIAPARKVDPGPLFPWEDLANAGIGAWPDAATVSRYLAGRDPREPVTNIALLQAQLRQYGYDAPLTGQFDPGTVQVLRAFQMHFRPSDYSGVADAQTQAILQALLEKYPIPMSEE